MEMSLEEKSIHNNRLTLQIDDYIQSGYEVKMLLRNNINGILDRELLIINDQTQICYDISKKESLDMFLKEKMLDCHEAIGILKKIIKGVCEAGDYLLKEENFIINKEYIFVDRLGEEVGLCYLPTYNINCINQFRSLVEFLMDKVDYKNEKAVVMIYGLYKIVRNKDCTLSEIIDFLNINDTNKNNTNTNNANKNDINNENISFVNSSKQCEVKYIQRDTAAGAYIPRVEEKIEEEEEIQVHSKNSIIIFILGNIFIAVLSVLVWKSGFLYVSQKINLMRLIASGFIVLGLEGTLFLNTLSNKNKIPKIITTVKYKDPIIEGHEEQEEEKTSILNITQSSKTECLFRQPSEIKFILKAVDQEMYSDIEIVEFPFFIGKIKAQVNHCIENPMVSRYHAKIEEKGSRYFLTDLDSTNGTYVDDQKLAPQESREIDFGQKISFAMIDFYFTN